MHAIHLKLNRKLRWVVILALGLALLWLGLGYILAPLVLRDAIDREIQAALGVKPHIGAIAVSPLTLGVTVQDIRIAYPDTGKDMLSIDAVEVSAGLASLYRLAPVLSQARVVNPVFNMSYLGHNRFSFSDLIKEEERATGEAEDIFKNIFPMAVNQLDIVNGTVNLDIIPLGSSHVVSEINLSLPFISSLETHQDTPARPTLTARVDGSPISVTGEMFLFGQTRRTEFNINIDALDFEKFRQDVASSLHLNLNSGQVSTALSLVLEQHGDKHAELALAGLLKLRDVDVAMSGQEKSALTMRSADISIRHLTRTGPAVEIDRLAADGLSVRLRQAPDGSLDGLNWLASLREDSAEGTDPSATPAEQPSFKAANIDISNSTFIFIDESQGQERETILRDLNLASDEFSSDQGGRWSLSFSSGQQGQLELEAIMAWPDARKDTLAASGLFTARETPLVGLTPLYRAHGFNGLTGYMTGQGSFTLYLDKRRYLGGRIDLKDLALSTEKPTDNILSLASAEITLRHLDMLDMDLEVSRLAVESLDLKVVRGPDGSIDWVNRFSDSAGPQSDWIKKLHALYAQKTPKNGDSDNLDHLPQIIVSDLSLSKSKLRFRDETLTGRPEILVNNIEIDSQEFSTISGGQASLSCQLAGTGSLTLQAKISPPEPAKKKPLSMTGTLNIKNIPLSSAKPFFNNNVLAGLTGQASGQGDLTLTIPESEPINLTLKNGRASLGNFNLNVKNPQAGRSMFRVGNADLRGAAFDLTGKTVSADSLTLKDSDFALTVRDGQILWPEQLIAPWTNAETEPPEQPWTWTLKNLIVQQGNVEIIPKQAAAGPATADSGQADQTRTLKISSIEASAGPISSVSEIESRLSLTATWQRSGSIAAQGTARLSPLRLDMDFVLDKLGLRILDAIMGRQLQPLVINGRFGGNLRLALRQDKDRLDVRTSGSGEISNLSAQMEPNRPPFLQCASVKIDHLDYNDPANTLNIKAVTLDKPAYDLYIAPDGQSTIGRLVALIREKVGPSKPGSPPLLMTVDSYTIQDGQLGLTDRRTSPTMRVRMNNLQAQMTGFNTARGAAPAHFTLNALFEGAPLKMNGTLGNAFDSPELNMIMNVDQLDLMPLSAYSLYYVAYPVHQGQLTLVSDVKLKNSILAIDNKVKIVNLELGKKDTRPGAPDYSLEFGLAMLKDITGVIDFSLPMQGNVTDPGFRLGALAGTAFKNMMLRLITSPFALLAGMFQLGLSSSGDTYVVMFQPGSAILTPEGKKSIESLAERLAKNPKLTAGICGRYDPIQDAQGLQEVRLQRRLQMVKYESLSMRQRRDISLEEIVIEADEYDTLLQKVYLQAKIEHKLDQSGRVLVPTRAEMEAQLRRQTETADLQGLALERARRARDHLLGIGPSGLNARVSLGCADGSGGKGTQTSVEFTLK